MPGARLITLLTARRAQTSMSLVTASIGLTMALPHFAARVRTSDIPFQPEHKSLPRLLSLWGGAFSSLLALTMSASLNPWDSSTELLACYTGLLAIHFPLTDTSRNTGFHHALTHWRAG